MNGGEGRKTPRGTKTCAHPEQTPHKNGRRVRHKDGAAEEQLAATAPAARHDGGVHHTAAAAAAAAAAAPHHIKQEVDLTQQQAHSQQGVIEHVNLVSSDESDDETEEVAGPRHNWPLKSQTRADSILNYADRVNRQAKEAVHRMNAEAAKAHVALGHELDDAPSWMQQQLNQQPRAGAAAAMHGSNFSGDQLLSAGPSRGGFVGSDHDAAAEMGGQPAHSQCHKRGGIPPPIGGNGRMHTPTTNAGIGGSSAAAAAAAAAATAALTGGGRLGSTMQHKPAAYAGFNVAGASAAARATASLGGGRSPSTYQRRTVNNTHGPNMQWGRAGGAANVSGAAQHQGASGGAGVGQGTPQPNGVRRGRLHGSTAAPQPQQQQQQQQQRMGAGSYAPGGNNRAPAAPFVARGRPSSSRRNVFQGAGDDGEADDNASVAGGGQAGGGQAGGRGGGTALNSDDEQFEQAAAAAGRAQIMKMGQVRTWLQSHQPTQSDVDVAPGGPRHHGFRLMMDEMLVLSHANPDMDACWQVGIKCRSVRDPNITDAHQDQGLRFDAFMKDKCWYCWGCKDDPGTPLLVYGILAKMRKFGGKPAVGGLPLNAVRMGNPPGSRGRRASEGWEEELPATPASVPGPYSGTYMVACCPEHANLLAAALDVSSGSLPGWYNGRIRVHGVGPAGDVVEGTTVPTLPAVKHPVCKMLEATRPHLMAGVNEVIEGWLDQVGGLDVIPKMRGPPDEDEQGVSGM